MRGRLIALPVLLAILLASALLLAAPSPSPSGSAPPRDVAVASVEHVAPPTTPTASEEPGLGRRPILHGLVAAAFLIVSGLIGANDHSGPDAKSRRVPKPPVA